MPIGTIVTDVAIAHFAIIGTRRLTVAHIIVDTCTKDALCVDACPNDSIHPTKDEAEFDGATQLYINPDECLDCGACIPECPVQAIYADSDLPEKYKSFTALNATKSKELPVITQKKTPLAEPKK